MRVILSPNETWHRGLGAMACGDGHEVVRMSGAPALYPRTPSTSVGPDYARAVSAIADGYKLNTVGSATWMSDGKPWATFTLEDVRYNVDVASYVLDRGL